MGVHEELLRLVRDAGAGEAALLDASEIALSESFRSICERNACGKFGRCWMCPPDIGEIGELMAQIRLYRQALLYQSVHAIEDSFDIEGMGEGAARHARMSQAVDRAVKPLLPGCLHLSCGGCNLCPRCARLDGGPCRHPENALPPMEGYGIDVYHTARAAGQRYTNGKNTVTFFGIVLF